VNAVGESRGSVSVVAWAYAPPTEPTNVTWTPTRATGGDGTRIDIELDITDATTSELRITSPNGETQVVPVAGKGHKIISAYFMGSNTPELVTVTPVTGLELPPVDGAQAQGAAVSFLANGVGKPTIGTIDSSVDAGGTSATLTVSISSGGTGSETWVGIESGGACTDMAQATGGTATVTATLTPNVANRITVCAESRFGGLMFAAAEAKSVTVYPWVDPGAPSVTTGFRVDTVCSGDGMSCSTGVTAPVIDLAGLPVTVGVLYSFDAGPLTADFSEMPIGVPVEVSGVLCVVFDARNSQCSETLGTIGPEPGYANYRTSVTVSPCAVGEAPVVSVAGSASHWSAVWTLRDENGVETSDYTLMRTAQVTVSFTDALQGIADWTSDTMTCTGAPDPEPDPSGSPTP
jgi:hypothetical protein